MTKQIDTYQAQEKEYTGRIVLGKTTPSFDRETPVDAEFDIRHVTPEMVIGAANASWGPLSRFRPCTRPSGGRQTHVRAGPQRAEPSNSRPAGTISHFDVTDVNLPTLDFRIVCSKGRTSQPGTRPGRGLGAGAYLDELRRTRIGAFHVGEAQTVNDFVQQFRQSV
jgi:tRNA pseudouridine55 synthase